jgi:hypothetical protein
MEILIFLNGILFALCALSFVQCVRDKKKKFPPAPSELPMDEKKLTPDEQWRNMLSFTGMEEVKKNED